MALVHDTRVRCKQGTMPKNILWAKKKNTLWVIKSELNPQLYLRKPSPMLHISCNEAEFDNLKECFILKKKKIWMAVYICLS